MKKRDLFIQAMKADRYMELAWCVRAFAKCGAEKFDDADAKLWDLYSDDSGHYFFASSNTLEKVEDADPSEPLFSMSERLTIGVDDCINNDKERLTTYGNLLANCITLVYPFGNKVKYHNKDFYKNPVSALLIKRLKDDPEEGQEANPNDLYVSEYYKYSEAKDYLRSFSNLCVQTTTEKLLQPAPGIAEYKAQLLEENKDKLDDLEVIAGISAKLRAFDDAYLKGDPGEKFLLGGKARNVVRQKKFVMLGAESGLEDNAVKGTLIANSLHEGWDITKFPEMNNNSRSGSFNRGAQTALGGVSVKWLQRAASNVRITIDDCGSQMGSEVFFGEKDYDEYYGDTILDGGKKVKIDSEEVYGRYLGKMVTLRNPQYCPLDFTDYCKTCCGDKLSVNPDGGSIAITGKGSEMMAMFMAAMHGKQLSTAKMNYMEVFF